ncbi:spore germination protein [Intestinimonas massiliensis]|nr:spore germination protein [Intestinimonas massiliensis (ex Afouda et al. 2020)]
MESIRTNTSLVRRRLRAPSLKIKELLVGRV